MRTGSVLPLVMLAMFALAREASAGWYYGWNCTGQCAPNELAQKGVEGPYGSEEECETAKSNDSYHHDLMLAPGNFGTFDGCYEEGGSSSSSSGGGYSGGGTYRGGGGPPEIRFMGGTRMFVFDAGIHTEKTMAGLTPDQINANAKINPGVIVTLQLDQPKWSGLLLDVTYYRNTLSSQSTDLGVLSGATIMFGYERGKQLGHSRCGLQGQFAFGARLGYFSASDMNTEAKAEDLNSFNYNASFRLGLSCRITDGGTWLDLATGVYYSPTSYEAGNGDLLDPQDEVWIRTSSAGMIGGLGLTFMP